MGDEMIASTSASKACISEGSWLISAEFEQHCIELADIEKRKKNAQNKVEGLELQTNRLDDRKAAI